MEVNDAGFTEVTRQSKKRRRNSNSPTNNELTSRASRAMRRNEGRSPNRFEVLLEAVRDEGAIDEEFEAGLQGDAIDEAGEGVLVNEMLNWGQVSEGVTQVLISDNEEELGLQCSGQRRVMQFVAEGARFSEAVADQGRWSASASSGDSSSPGSTGRSVAREPTVREHRRAAPGRPVRPARAIASPLRLCCANHCGKMFEGRKAKSELRHHFEIESVVCRPCEANYDHYKDNYIMSLVRISDWSIDCTVRLGATRHRIRRS